ncbi:IS701 family transposase [Aurantimonas sp. E1-2-R+4]|uniref:IS701 family transposase n=1 Tax=Aurantimonas sp. E1-2-R+4 TaxID=3113714 RepID=UPI002F94BA4B
MIRRSWMMGASIEETLELWASSLRDVKRRIRPLFRQERVAASAGLFLDGLLGDERRKTGWMRAEAAGDPGPWRQQAILGRGRWDADALRDIVRDYVVETLADPEAVLVIDETGFLKQGKASCGVGRQYTGSAGKITNCQIGVFASYVSRHGHAFIDRALYLPKAWTSDPARMAAAHVPPETNFATKPAIALAMIERAMAAGVPFARVAADSVYGVGGIETALRRAGKGYVLGVNANHPFNSWDKPRPVAGTAAAIAGKLSPDDWTRLSAGNGTKGERLHDWAYLDLADLDAGEYDEALTGLWTRGLLIRRNIADGDMAFFSTWCPAGTGLETLVRVEGYRWAIEDSFETAKNELGLDHNETRSWHGWHRHVSLVMLAFAMMTTIRHHANTVTPPKSMVRIINAPRRR